MLRTFDNSKYYYFCNIIIPNFCYIQRRFFSVFILEMFQMMSECVSEAMDEVNFGIA